MPSSAPKTPRCGTQTSWSSGGTLLGRIHALTHRYAPSSPALKRPTWSEDELLLNAERYAAPAFPNLTRDLETHLDWLSTLPQDPHSFGLVHGDANWGNFHVHQDQITLFDFDDCRYHWFIYDFAIPMYYFALYHDGIDEDRLRFFFDPFVRGYLSERPLPLSWFDLLPRFCSFRDILLTLFACKTQMSPDHLFYQSVTRNYTLGNHLHNFDFTAFQQTARNA